MFARTLRTSRTVQVSAKRFYSAGHGHGHGPEKPKEVEVSISKIFGVAAVAGGVYFYLRSDRDDPYIKTPLYKQQDERAEIRNQNYERRYRTSFIKQFIRDNGGIGRSEYRQASEDYFPTTIIPAHSPYGNQFGAGIKTDGLGPRREPARSYAPLSTEQ